MYSRKTKTPLENRVIIDFLNTSKKEPFGKVVKFVPQNSAQRNRTQRQIQKRKVTFLQRLSRLFNRK